MVRREISIEFPHGDHLGIVRLLIDFAGRLGWSARDSGHDVVLLLQEFPDEAAASAATSRIDEVLTQVGSFSAAVR